VLIPRIFHQIWVGPDPYPKKLESYRQSWLDLNPGWELRFWTEDNLPDGLRRPEARERLRVPAERADIFRLEALWREGGVYMDTDFECLRPIEPLIDDVDFFCAYRKLDRMNNAFIGSVAGHPILEQALDEMRPTTTYGYDKTAAGPEFLGSLLAGHPEAKIFEAEVFYPRTAATRRNAYAIHHKSQTWKEAKWLRKELDRFKVKLRKTQDEAHAWRLRAEQAERELEQLRVRK
jgi:mannosyltransferase OCH1-like enzyme